MEQTEEILVEKTTLKVPLPDVEGELNITIKGFRITNKKAEEVTQAICEALSLSWTEIDIKHSEDVKTRRIKGKKDQLDILIDEIEEEAQCRKDGSTFNPDNAGNQNDLEDQ